MNPFKKLFLHKAEANLGALAFFALLANLGELAMFYWNFWESGQGREPYQVPGQMLLLLWGTILIYAVPKEITRWFHPKGGNSVGSRRGQIWPLLWGISLGLMGAVEWKSEGAYRIPENMGEAVLGTIIIFLVSLASKWARMCQNGHPDCLDREPAEETEMTEDPAA